MLLFGDRANAALENPAPDADYVEVELRFFPPRPDGQTPVELRTFGIRQEFPATSVPLDLAALSALDISPRQYGEALGHQLLDNTVLGTQFTVLDAVLSARNAHWRIRLRLDHPALQTVRWERLCRPVNGQWLPIASVGDSPFSRYVTSDWKTSAPLTERPVDVLLVYASPAGLSRVKLPLIPPTERDAIRAAFTDGAAGLVSVNELASDSAATPTLAALRSALIKSPAIVHILCHGTSGPAGSALVLQTDTGDASIVQPSELVDAFRNAATRPRLVVLSACESAANNGTSAFVSLAPALAESGVDAVLAMSDAVSANTARAFCTEFYRRLFAHGVIDRAVNEARATVRDALDWGTPVLFARQRDCQLLDFSAGRVDAAYLGASNRTVRAALAARAFGERQSAATGVVHAIDALIGELGKSHRVITGVASQFRRTGTDSATFPAQFTNFRNEFKDYFDSKLWLDERTHCHEVEARATPALALFKDALSPDAYNELRGDLAQLSAADGTIIRYLDEFLQLMDSEVNAIYALIRAGDISQAINRKMTFEDQITPTFRRSKELLTEIAERSETVRA